MCEATGQLATQMLKNESETPEHLSQFSSFKLDPDSLIYSFCQSLIQDYVIKPITR